MDYAELPAHFLDDLRWLCQELNPDGTRLSRDVLADLGIEVIPGPRANYMPRHPLDPDDFPAVMLPFHQFGWTETNTLRHELLHALVDHTGCVDEVIRRYGGDKRAAQPTLERLRWLAEAFWRIPQASVDTALRMFPLDGELAMLLHRVARVTPEQAMVRLVFDDPGCSVAGFVVSGGVIRATATCNSVLPFFPYQRVPALPDGVRLSRLAPCRVGIVA